jgi:putative transposase
MNYDHNTHNRRSIRLKGYDYSQEGVYFVTICSANGKCLFSDINNGHIDLNHFGEIVYRCWLDIPIHYPNVQLDEFVVMPNHIHGIVIIDRQIVGVQNIEPLQQNRYQHIIPGSLGAIIRGFKIGVTKWLHRYKNIHRIWQRNYYEHIIRNESELNRIRKYIIENPLKWEDDEYNPIYYEKI